MNQGVFLCFYKYEIYFQFLSLEKEVEEVMQDRICIRINQRKPSDGSGSADPGIFHPDGSSRHPC